jgi:uncharacterized Zn finger protein
MNEPEKEQGDRMVQCPACGGQGEFRGSITKIKWSACAYCEGTGGVTEKRYYAWHERSAKFAVSSAARELPQDAAGAPPSPIYVADE